MAIQFNVPGDRVYLAATLPAPGSTGLTILGWWRMKTAASFETYYRTSTTAGASTIHTVGNTSSARDVNVYTTAGDITTGAVAAADQWMAIAVTDNGAGVSLFTRPQGASTTFMSGSVGSGTPAHFCIGGRDATNINETLNGNAAYVRVYSAALTQTQIETEWASTTPVRTSGLWADYPFISNIQDASGNSRHLTTVSGTPTFETGPTLTVPDTPYRVTVGTTPVRLTPADTGPQGRRVVIRNTNATTANTVSLGGASSVTAANGFLLDGGTQMTLPLSAGEEVWAVRGASTDVAVHVLRLGD